MNVGTNQDCLGCPGPSCLTSLYFVLDVWRLCTPQYWDCCPEDQYRLQPSETCSESSVLFLMKKDLREAFKNGHYHHHPIINETKLGFIKEDNKSNKQIIIWCHIYKVTLKQEDGTIYVSLACIFMFNIKYSSVLKLNCLKINYYKTNILLSNKCYLTN